MARGGASRHEGGRFALLAAFAGLTALAAALACGPGGEKPGSIEAPAPAAQAIYVGAVACDPCHEAQTAAWRTSHHALAMAAATPASVLGDFHDARFTSHGVTSTFSSRDGKFFVRTEGPDGKPADFPIAYTFGVRPLQQYLVPFPGGRYQALSIAWDSRPAGEGGQRWFRLYPDEHIPFDDELHWTGAQQNWNFMCAECHSTDLRKNYDAATNAYRTTWSEVNVSCEACHGPGSLHVDWAERKARGETAADPAMGLTVSFTERRSLLWIDDPQTGTRRPTEPRPLRVELETCAPCHARRTPIADGFEAGKPFLDYYLPSLLEPPLYYADGQQRDEVYVWGSFVQSRMYHRGVTCSDCHEPHDLRLRSTGNALCTNCHAPAKFDAPSHHFHKPDGPGARCVGCHMPETNYMVIDARADHSMRVPRPDLTVALGVPNACNACHHEKTPEWAAESVERWYGHPARGYQTFAPALDAAARDGADAPGRLEELLRDRDQPAIARATAATALARGDDPAGVRAALEALADGSPLVRRSALQAAGRLAPEECVRAAAPLLEDPVRIVRIEAASVLAPFPPSALTQAQARAFDRAAAEYEAAQRLSADRPEHRVNLGTFYAQRGRHAESEAEFRAAIALRPDYVPAWANLADLRRLQGRDADAEAVLRKGIEKSPRDGSLHHALGLTLIRLGRSEEAVRELDRAARLAPENPRFAYVHAVALHDTGRTREALRAIDAALARHPGNRDLLLAGATFSRDAGDRAAALGYAERLAARSPGDPAVRRLVEELR